MNLPGVSVGEGAPLESGDQHRSEHYQEPKARATDPDRGPKTGQGVPAGAGGGEGQDAGEGVAPACGLVEERAAGASGERPPPPDAPGGLAGGLAWRYNVFTGSTSTVVGGLRLAVMPEEKVWGWVVEELRLIGEGTAPNEAAAQLAAVACARAHIKKQVAQLHTALGFLGVGRLQVMGYVSEWGWYGQGTTGESTAGEPAASWRGLRLDLGRGSVVVPVREGLVGYRLGSKVRVVITEED